MRLVLFAVILLCSCANRATVAGAHPSQQAAKVFVQGNPSVVANFFLTVLTLGLLGDLDDTGDKVMIRTVNGRDVYCESISVEPGPNSVGLVFDGLGSVKSKGLLLLSFNATDGGKYNVVWRTSHLSGASWSATIESNGTVLTKGTGELYIPEPVGVAPNQSLQPTRFAGDR